MSNTKKNVPEIRFPGFTEAWEQRKFGEIATRLSDTEMSNDNLPSVEYEDIESGYGRLNKDIYSKSNPKKGILFNEENVLYGKLRPYLHNWLNPDFTGVAVGDWWVLSPNGITSDFLYTLIQTKSFDDVANQSSGTKMPRADWKLVSETCFCIPNSMEEQHQISVLINTLDTAITLHQRKCDELKIYKKGMLQKMFPQPGETKPQVRFPGFTEAWEQRKFGDVGSVSMCKRVFKEETSTEGDIPFYKIGTFGSTPDAFISEGLFEEYKRKFSYPKVGDILLSASGTIGRLVEYAGERAYFQDSNIVWLNHDNTIDNSFLKVLYGLVSWHGNLELP